MKDVAHWAVVQNHDLAEVWLDLAEVLDVRSITERTVLTIIPSAKILALTLKPIDDGIRVLLDRSGEDYEIVPFAHLINRQRQKTTFGIRAVAENRLTFRRKS